MSNQLQGQPNAQITVDQIQAQSNAFGSVAKMDTNHLNSEMLMSSHMQQPPQPGMFGVGSTQLAAEFQSTPNTELKMEPPFGMVQQPNAMALIGPQIGLNQSQIRSIEMAPNAASTAAASSQPNAQPQQVAHQDMTGNYVLLGCVDSGSQDFDEEYLRLGEEDTTSDEDDSLLLANRMRHNSLCEVYTIPEETEEDLLSFGTCVRGMLHNDSIRSETFAFRLSFNLPIRFRHDRFFYFIVRVVRLFVKHD